MKERMVTYLKWMDGMLASQEEDVDYAQLMKRHLREIAFFQHERLVHLLVMFLVLLVSVLVFLSIMRQFIPSLVILFLALLVLDIPYIKHYFLLENGVQKMYYQYDALYEKLYPAQPAPKFTKRPSYVK